MQCELCEREIDHLTVHHLIPKQKTKRKKDRREKKDLGPTINICSACHRQIHNLFDHTRLADELNSPEKLKREPQMQKFLTWIKKQDPRRRVPVDRKRA